MLCNVKMFAIKRIKKMSVDVADTDRNTCSKKNRITHHTTLLVMDRVDKTSLLRDGEDFSGKYQKHHTLSADLYGVSPKTHYKI